MVEEFTFPTVVLPPEHYCCDKLAPFPRLGAASPLAWFVVSSAGDGAGHDHHRRCVSAVVEHPAGAGRGVDDGGRNCCYRRGSERFADATVKEEHGMDLLWEDFNEELSRAAPPPCPISKEWASEAWLPGGGGGGGDEPSRHVAAGGSVIRPRRRLSLMMMLKLLKRLFMARKSKAASSLPQGGAGRRHQYD